MRLQQLPILLFAILVFSGCDNDDVARVIDPPALTTDEQIIADCYVVRDALEAFADENGGVYPLDLNDQSDTGSPFITFLPNDARLTNRYTDLATSPVFYHPQWPGEIGVVLYSELSEYGDTPPTGYRVVGHGRDGTLVALDNLSTISPEVVAKYDSVIVNCETVLAAAREFNRQAGHYPGSVGGDTMPSGDVLSDLLPNGGALLTNPFSYLLDSPVDGNSPVDIGSVAVYPWEGKSGEKTSYTVAGAGSRFDATVVVRTPASQEDMLVRETAFDLRWAVELFAIQNGGEYPRDLDADVTPGGDTAQDIMYTTSYFRPYPNPYNGTPSIRDGLATSRGEVGYVPMEYNGIVVGYVINALGLFNEELERFEVLTN